uniref:NADH-ubiquinone oxidoreductase 75 kDa subunit, mitochondrial n=1 Tax=Hucho hucho TaxID=62062 RepID=A0A4W5LD75_9TELE
WVRIPLITLIFYNTKSPFSLVVRTLPFHGNNTGSNPVKACNSLNIQIPKFCFQENLKIAGNCRMCLVEIKNSPK